MAGGRTTTSKLGKLGKGKGGKISWRVGTQEDNVKALGSVTKNRSREQLPKEAEGMNVFVVRMEEGQV